MLAVLRQAVWRRRLSTLWWSLSLIAFVALLALAYPTIRGNTALDQTFAGLPPGVLAALGLDAGSALTSPIGYLNSQYFANILPALFLIFAIGLAAWSISGDEAAGTLELLLANPVSRVRLSAERAGGAPGAASRPDSGGSGNARHPGPGCRPGPGSQRRPADCRDRGECAASIDLCRRGLQPGSGDRITVVGAVGRLGPGGHRIRRGGARRPGTGAAVNPNRVSLALGTGQCAPTPRTDLAGVAAPPGSEPHSHGDRRRRLCLPRRKVTLLSDSHRLQRRVDPSRRRITARPAGGRLRVRREKQAS